MKVKKFVCKKCGAPKINPYKGIFVVCDFCNSMIEIDMWAKFEKENEDQSIIDKRNRLYREYDERTAELVNDNDQEGLLAFLQDHMIKVYELAPHALPPNLPQGEKYQ